MPVVACYTVSAYLSFGKEFREEEATGNSVTLHMLAFNGHSLRRPRQQRVTKALTNGLTNGGFSGGGREGRRKSPRCLPFNQDQSAVKHSSSQSWPGMT